MNFKDFLSFILQYFGVAGTGDTPDNKGQCVGLIEVWIDKLGLTHDWGNAKDLLNNADTSKFDVIQNTPEGFPLCGDILVLNWGTYGHTGIVVTADVNKIILFEQNNPTGNPPRISEINYKGVLGWLHPKNFNIDQQTIIDDLRTARDTNYNNWQSELIKNNDLTKQIQDLQAKNQNLRDAFDLQTKADASTGAELLDAQHKATDLQNEIQSIAEALSAPTDLKSILTAIDSLRTPIEEQVKPLQQHALSLQRVIDDFIYQRVPKSKFFDWLRKIFKV